MASDPNIQPTVSDRIVVESPRYIKGPAGVLEDFRLRHTPRWMVYTAIFLVSASWIPLSLIYLSRHRLNTLPRIHIFQDMDNQPMFKPQDQNPLFLDGRAMRPKIPGTVARGRLSEDPHFSAGFTSGPADAEGRPTVQFFDGYPANVQAMLDDPAQAERMLRRGQDRYNIYCAPCHGADGYGAGPVHVRSNALGLNGVEGMSWVQPKSMHDADVRARPDGHLFNTITNGIRNMGGYGGQINVPDRWAIVAYVRTLQFAQAARGDAIPADRRGQLR
jgi:mono/diheme cytochrome c family protein